MTNQYYYEQYQTPKPYIIYDLQHYVFIRKNRNANEYHIVIALKQKNIFICRAVLGITFSAEEQIKSYLDEYFLTNHASVSTYRGFFEEYEKSGDKRYLQSREFASILHFKDFSFFESSVNCKINGYFNRDLYSIILSDFRHFYDCDDSVAQNQINYCKKIQALPIDCLTSYRVVNNRGSATTNGHRPELDVGAWKKKYNESLKAC